MDIQVTLVRELTEKQFDRIVDIAQIAFAKDIVVQSMFGADPTLSDLGTRAIYKAGLLEGSIFIATETSSDKILGIALGFGPGRGLYMTEAQRALGYNDLWASYPDHLKAWWTNEFIPIQSQLKETAVGLDRIFQSWYIDNLATDPEHQGRGVGIALIKAACAKAKEDNVPLYLNALTESNVLWYKKRGFTEKGTTEYTALPALGGEKCQSTLLVWGESDKIEAEAKEDS